MAFVGFRFGMRPVSRQASTTEAICAQLALMSRRFLKQLPRARTGFSERQARVAVACFLHRQNSQGQSIHAIFEQRGRLRIGVNERRHARPQSRTYAIFTSLTISNWPDYKMENSGTTEIYWRESVVWQRHIYLH